MRDNLLIEKEEIDVLKFFPKISLEKINFSNKVEQFDKDITYIESLIYNKYEINVNKVVNIFEKYYKLFL